MNFQHKENCSKTTLSPGKLIKKNMKTSYSWDALKIKFAFVINIFTVEIYSGNSCVLTQGICCCAIYFSIIDNFGEICSTLIFKMPWSLVTQIVSHLNDIFSGWLFVVDRAINYLVLLYFYFHRKYFPSLIIWKEFMQDGIFFYKFL